MPLKKRKKNILKILIDSRDIFKAPGPMFRLSIRIVKRMFIIIATGNTFQFSLMF
jgi:hypothetical protein